MPPSYGVLHRCPNSPVPRKMDRHDITPPDMSHSAYTPGLGRMVQCVDCGSEHVFTLYGALKFGCEPHFLEQFCTVISPEAAETLREGILRLERYALERWGIV